MMDYFNSFESHMVSQIKGFQQNCFILSNKLKNQPAIKEVWGLKSTNKVALKTPKLLNCPVPTLLKFLYIFIFQDFEGQSKAEFVSRTIVVLFGVVGFVFGWYIEQFSQTVYILGAGLVFAAIVSVLQYKSRKIIIPV